MDTFVSIIEVSTWIGGAGGIFAILLDILNSKPWETSIATRISEGADHRADTEEEQREPSIEEILQGLLDSTRKIEEEIVEGRAPMSEHRRVLTEKEERLESKLESLLNSTQKIEEEIAESRASMNQRLDELNEPLQKLAKYESESQRGLKSSPVVEVESLPPLTAK